MSPIVLRQEKVIVILMKGKIDYRSLEIEDLIERGLGSGDSLGEGFHPRTYSLGCFFSSHRIRTQSSRLKRWESSGESMCFMIIKNTLKNKDPLI